MNSSIPVSRLGCALALSILANSAMSHAGPTLDPAANQALARARARASIAFEAKPGSRVVAHASGYEVSLLRGVRVTERRDDQSPPSRMLLVGANRSATPELEQPVRPTAVDPGHSNQRVAYRNAYRGIDAVFQGRAGSIEYDFEVAPGADARAIRLSFPDARALAVDAQSGDLLVTDKAGEITRHTRPEVYQQTGADRQNVEGRFHLRTARTVSFDVGAYDHARRLIIDPVIVKATRFIKGNNNDYGVSIAVDAAGYSYVAGITGSTKGFPNGGTNSVVLGPKDCSLWVSLVEYAPCPSSAFLVKMDPAGNIVASVLFGGTGTTYPAALAVDDRHVYVVGSTNSPVMTTAQNQNAFVTHAYGPVPKKGTNRAFLAEFDLSLGSLQTVTTLAGYKNTAANGISVVNYVPYLTGGSCGGGFYTTPGAYQSAPNGDCDAFVTKLDTQATLSNTIGPVYSTYLGGSGSVASWGPVGDAGFAVAVDPTGQAWVTGITCSTNFPTWTSYYGSPGVQGSCNAFLTEMNSTGTGYVHSVYFGGSKWRNAYDVIDDAGLSVALDGSGGAYVAGQANSLTFYTTPGSVEPTGAPPTSGFVTHIDANFLVTASTYLGGKAASGSYSVVRSPAGEIYVGGVIEGSTEGFPGAPVEPLSQYGYVTKLSPALDTVRMFQYLGRSVNGLVAHSGSAGYTSVWATGSRSASPVTATDAGFDGFMVFDSDPITYVISNPCLACGIHF